MPKKETPEAAAMKMAKRLEKLLGEGWPAIIRQALAVNQTTIWRWTENGFPRHIDALVELLEATPRAHWPSRWLR
jgi:hypothetical protein